MVDTLEAQQQLTTVDRPPDLPSCPLCGESAVLHVRMPIDSKTFEPTSFGTIVRCTGCSFLFVSPRPSPADTSVFYELDAYYTQGKSHFIRCEKDLLDRVLMHLAWRADRSTSLYAELTRRIPTGSRVLDIGCGQGALVHALTDAGYAVTGVERDAVSLSRRSGRMNVLEGSAESLPPSLQGGSFDAVVFSHVLEHLVDPVGAVKKAASLLKNGGLLICEVPNNESMISRESGLAWEHLDIPRHINFFTQDSLSVMASAAGLRVSDSYFTGYCRYFDPSYAATEQRIADRVRMLADPHLARGWSRARGWLLLARTVGAAPHLKYDSVGLLAHVTNT